MPQVFRRETDSVVRMALLLGALSAPAGLWIALSYLRSAFTVPTPASCERNGCRSATSTTSACWESTAAIATPRGGSSFAGLPATTKTCMNCHSQMWVGSAMLAPVRESYRTDRSLRWHRVYNLPGFVYFDHSIHVHKGIGCSSCHGRIDEMPLTYQVPSLLMEWCIDCHRHPERANSARERSVQHPIPAAGRPGSSCGQQLARGLST